MLLLTSACGVVKQRSTACGANGTNKYSLYAYKPPTSNAPCHPVHVSHQLEGLPTLLKSRPPIDDPSKKKPKPWHERIAWPWRAGTRCSTPLGWMPSAAS